MCVIWTSSLTRGVCSSELFIIGRCPSLRDFRCYEWLLWAKRLLLMSLRHSEVSVTGRCSLLGDLFVVAKNPLLLNVFHWEVSVIAVCLFLLTVCYC